MSTKIHKMTRNFLIYQLHLALDVSKFKLSCLPTDELEGLYRKTFGK